MINYCRNKPGVASRALAVPDCEAFKKETRRELLELRLILDEFPVPVMFGGVHHIFSPPCWAVRVDKQSSLSASSTTPTRLNYPSLTGGEMGPAVFPACDFSRPVIPSPPKAECIPNSQSGHPLSRLNADRPERFYGPTQRAASGVNYDS